MMHRPKATTLRSCEIKDDAAEGIAQRHPKQGSANRGTRWRGRRPGRFREEGGEGRVRRGTKVRSGAYGRRPSFYSIAGEVKRGLRPPSSTHLKRKVCPLIKKIMLLLCFECCVVCVRPRPNCLRKSPCRNWFNECGRCK